MTSPFAAAPTELEERAASVVIIDDTPDIRLLLTVALGRHPGFEVVGEASDGRAGVELVGRLQPDAVVLDIAMPTLDGLRALPLLREAAPGTTVVVLSGFETSQMRAAALAAGASAYVQKGTSLSQIVDTVAGCLGLQLAERPEATRPAPVPVPNDPSSTSSVASPRAEDTPDRYRQLLDKGVRHGLVALSFDGRIETWNASAERITGYPAAEVVGQDVSVLYPDVEHKEHGSHRLMREAQSSSRATESRWLVAQDGARRWVDIALSSLGDSHGENCGFALEIHDRTEDRQLEETQSSLFAAVSHDLRAPINAIRAFASLLTGVTADNQAKFAERIDANAEQLQRLVEGLFDYAKVRAGAVALGLEAVELGEFVRHATTNLSAVLAPFDLQIGDGEFVALADRASLRRVLDNILGNACKYSPAGSRLSVDFSRSEGFVRFVVTDQGRGIDPADLPTIFGEFVRGRLAENDGGTGLGLASVRHLVSLQGGTVSITSELGVGTAVTVELPQA